MADRDAKEEQKEAAMNDTVKKHKAGTANEPWKVNVIIRDISNIDRTLSILDDVFFEHPCNQNFCGRLNRLRQLSGDQIADLIEDYRTSHIESVRNGNPSLAELSDEEVVSLLTNPFKSFKMDKS